MSFANILPYVTAFAIVGLAGVVVISLARMFTSENDAIVIQVVPIDGSSAVEVQVVGAVEKPGVYSLSEGSTVSDAVKAGGAVGTEVDLDRDEVASDGQFIVIDGGSTTAALPGSSPIPINSAAVAELETLPGIGPVIARRIVDHRTAFGPFLNAEDLAAVSGISLRMVDELRHLIDIDVP